MLASETLYNRLKIPLPFAEYAWNVTTDSRATSVSAIGTFSFTCVCISKLTNMNTPL